MTILAVLIAAAAMIAVPAVPAPHASASPAATQDSSSRARTMCLQAHASIATQQSTDPDLGTGSGATVMADLTTAAAPANSQNVIRLQFDGHSLTQAPTTLFHSTTSVNNGGHGTAISHPSGPVTLSTACATLTPHFTNSARVRDGSVQRFTVDGTAFAPFAGANDCPTYEAVNFTPTYHCRTPAHHDCFTDRLQLMVTADHKIYAVTTEQVSDSRPSTPVDYQRLVRLQLDDVGLLQNDMVVAHAAPLSAPVNSGALLPSGRTLHALTTGAPYATSCNTFRVRAQLSYRFSDGTLTHGVVSSPYPTDCPPPSAPAGKQRLSTEPRSAAGVWSSVRECGLRMPLGESLLVVLFSGGEDVPAEQQQPQRRG